MIRCGRRSDKQAHAVIRARSLHRERGFPTGVGYTLHRNNVDTLRESVRMFAGFGVRSVLVGCVRNEIEASGMREHMLAHKELFDDCRAYLRELLEDGRHPISQMNIGDSSRSWTERWTHDRRRPGTSLEHLLACGVVHKGMHLSPESNILPRIPTSQDDEMKGAFPNVRDTTL